MWKSCWILCSAISVSENDIRRWEALMKYTGFIGLTLLLTATAAEADPRDEALSAMLRCSGTSDKAQRLACYDSAVVRVPGALNAPSAPIANAGPAAEAPAVTGKHRSGGFFSKVFGLDGPRRSPQTTAAQFGSESIGNGGTTAYPDAIDGDRIDEITARLVGYELNGGYMTVTLDNGQMWRQVSGEPVGHLQRAAASYEVIIGRGGAGAYSMKLSHFGRTLAVRRLR
jgi:hypothetical protein